MVTERQRNTELPEEEKTLQIYITQRDYERLDGNESLGSWYDHIEFSDTPSKEFCYKTEVPIDSVNDGVFDPSLSEPDNVVECCEKVSPKEIQRAERLEKEKEDKKRLLIKKGQAVWIAVHAIGITSYEDAKIGSVSKKKGVFYLDNGPGNDPSGPFDLKTGKNLYEAFPGFSFKVLTEKPEDYDKGGHEGY